MGVPVISVQRIVARSAMIVARTSQSSCRALVLGRVTISHHKGDKRKCHDNDEAQVRHDPQWPERLVRGKGEVAVGQSAGHRSSHVIGTILLGIAMWRSRAVPAWAALITIVSQPLHFIAAVILASHALDLVAWGLNAVGFAVAAIVIVRTSDDEWDLPPAAAQVASANG